MLIWDTSKLRVRVYLFRRWWRVYFDRPSQCGSLMVWRFGPIGVAVFRWNR
jgi:hypothetical protein